MGLQANQVEVKVKEVPWEEEFNPPLSSFGPHTDTTKDCNFDDEVVRLSFKFNLEEAPGATGLSPKLGI